MMTANRLFGAATIEQEENTGMDHPYVFVGLLFICEVLRSVLQGLRGRTTDDLVAAHVERACLQATWAKKSLCAVASLLQRFGVAPM